MAEYEVSYKNEEEKQIRYQIFKDNVQHIERHNQEGKHTYKLGINKFADQTNEEFLAKYARGFVPSFKVLSTNHSSFEYKDMKDVPPSLDWRDHNAVTPIETQGGCGCCWAFAVVAAIEGIEAIRSGKLTQLSEQHIIDCNDEREGCNGGRMDHAYEFVTKNGGLASDIDYPYTATQGACANIKPSSLSLKITGFSCIPNNNEAALLAAVSNQPVSVNIDPKLLHFYRSGVLSGECGTSLTHIVTIVGYGVSDNGVEFWLVKNSWGPGWGEGGYARVQRNVGFKEGMCGIAMFGCYPNV
ncbi:cathepsin L [Salvia divinorum]